MGTCAPTRVGGADAVRAAAGLGDASVVAAPPPSREVLGGGLSGCHCCTAAHGRWRVESRQCAESDGVIAMYGERAQRERVCVFVSAQRIVTFLYLHALYAHPNRALPRTRASGRRLGLRLRRGRRRHQELLRAALQAAGRPSQARAYPRRQPPAAHSARASPRTPPARSRSAT